MVAAQRRAFVERVASEVAKHEQVARAAQELAAVTDSEQVRAIAAEYDRNRNPLIRTTLVKSLGAIGEHNPLALSILVEKAAAEKSSPMRQAIATAVARAAANNPTGSHYVRFFERDADPAVRNALTESLRAFAHDRKRPVETGPARNKGGAQPRLKAGVAVPLPKEALEILTPRQAEVLIARGYFGGRPKGQVEVELEVGKQSSFVVENNALRNIREWLIAKKEGRRFIPHHVPRLAPDIPVPLSEDALAILTPNQRQIIVNRGYTGGPVKGYITARREASSAHNAMTEKLALKKIRAHIMLKRFLDSGRQADIPVDFIFSNYPAVAERMRRAGVRTIGEASQYSNTELVNKTGVSQGAISRLGREIRKYGLSFTLPSNRPRHLAEDIPTPIPLEALAGLTPYEKQYLERRGYLGGKIATFKEAAPGIRPNRAFRIEARALNKIRAALGLKSPTK